MSKFQLSESLQRLITSIIKKHPKIQTELLFLRNSFIQAVKDLNQNYWKILKKYQKTKQKLTNLQTTSSQGFNHFKGNFQAFYQNQKGDQQIKQQVTCQSNYEVDLMNMILNEAKSIKQIFESTLKASISQQQNQIATTTIINIYNSYKEFYKSFKRKQKEYVEHFSYNEKHIYKNSTQIKQRLLEELKAEIQKRKQLQAKLSALQGSIQKSIMHKNNKIKQLNHQLLKFKQNQGSNLYNSSFTCPNCNFSTNNPTQFQDMNDQEEIRSTKQTRFLKQAQSIICKKRYSKQTQLHSSESQQEAQYCQNQNNEQNQAQNLKNKQKISRLTNRSNLGKFYTGTRIFQIGKISQESYKSNQKYLSRQRSNNLLFQNKGQEKYEQKIIPQRSQQHKITFGNQKGVQKNQLYSNKAKNQNTKVSQDLQNQLNELKSQLLRQRSEKQTLQNKIQQSDQQYRKLESQVNQLYKLMEQQQNQIDLNNQKISNSLKNTSVKNQQEITELQTFRMLNKKSNHHLKQKKSIDSNFDQCDDIQQMIVKAQNSFLKIQNTQNFFEKTQGSKSKYEKINEMTSPKKQNNLRENNFNRKEFQLKKLASPPKNNSVIKQQNYQITKEREKAIVTPIKIPKNDKSIIYDMKSQQKRGKNSLSRTQSVDNKNMIPVTQCMPQSYIIRGIVNRDISSLSIRSNEKSNIVSPYKNVLLAQSRKRVQNEMKAELQEIEQYYADRVREKQEELEMFGNQLQRQQIRGNQLMLMLFTQAVTMEEFISQQNNISGNEQISEQYLL